MARFFTFEFVGSRRSLRALLLERFLGGEGGQTTILLLLLLLSCNRSDDNTEDLVCTEDDLFTTEQCPDTYPEFECTVFVDGDVESSGDGWSWDSPVKTVQEGVDLAHCGAVIEGICSEWEVWVKQGTYFIHKGCREHTVRLREQVALLGGFGGTETESYQRDWEDNVTTLNGRDAPDSENRVYHVVMGSDYATLDGFTITEGNADDEDEGSSNAWGGGMLNEYALPTIANCVFENNYATYGGGVSFTYDSGAGEASVVDCIFRNNKARLDGGALEVWTAKASIINSRFSDNVSGHAGGALRLAQGGDVYMEHCELDNNQATRFGGGIVMLVSSSLEVRDSDFSGNQALMSSFGGGIYVQASELLAEGCTFSENYAIFGGGVAIYSSSLATISDSDFNGNIADDCGGALAIVQSAATLTRSVIDSNTAEYNGGGVFLYAGGTLVADGIFVEGNSSRGGGGVCNKLSSDATFTNSVFSDNTALFIDDSNAIPEDGYGGGVLTHGSTTRLINTTLNGNSATSDGGAESSFSLDDTEHGQGFLESATTITNSILWNNGDSEISWSDATPEVTYSDVMGGFVGDGNIDLDPLFVDAASGDFHLQAGSPCIGAANPKVAPELDMDGNPRDDEPDMGAYEN